MDARRDAEKECLVAQARLDGAHEEFTRRQIFCRRVHYEKIPVRLMCEIAGQGETQRHRQEDGAIARRAPRRRRQPSGNCAAGGSKRRQEGRQEDEMYIYVVFTTYTLLVYLNICLNTDINFSTK